MASFVNVEGSYSVAPSVIRSLEPLLIALDWARLRQRKLEVLNEPRIFVKTEICDTCERLYLRYTRSNYVHQFHTY